VKLFIMLSSALILFSSMTAAQAMRCRDVGFSVRNTTGAIVRITKVRYRDFENHRTRTTDFNNRTLGRFGETGHIVALSIDLKNVRNEQVGEFEFQYQRQTAPPNVFGVSSWGPRRWTSRQGNINSCSNGQSSGFQVQLPS